MKKAAVAPNFPRQYTNKYNNGDAETTFKTVQYKNVPQKSLHSVLKSCPNSIKFFLMI